MPEGWCVGRKAIICYLRPYLGLSDDLHTAWRMVRRWRQRYALPIDNQPNGKPYLDPVIFDAFWSRFIEIRREKKKKMGLAPYAPL